MEVNIPSLDDVAFIQECSRCWGRGEVEVYVKRKYLMAPCESCRGLKRELSPVGKRLIEFLQSMGLAVSDPLNGS